MAASFGSADPRRGTRGRILGELRRSARTANEIADALGMTHNAVRAHLATLQRDGLVREAGLRRGETRPSVIYELVPQAEMMFSRAYVPFLAQLLAVLGEQMPASELDNLMRTVGRALAAEFAPLRGDLGERVHAAASLLEQLGALTRVEHEDGGFVLRGYGCMLGAAVHGRPEVCRAIESLLAQLVKAPVHECCERGEQPRCCFEILPSDSTPASALA
ncbi:MAG TPA: helix-turn-helix domain-containing protein [Gemmatimonadaceae bacterium]|nr:helix-turn-helix domain-containing protein [Gemmatimonadaceae bacterium]